VSWLLPSSAQNRGGSALARRPGSYRAGGADSDGLPLHRAHMFRACSSIRAVLTVIITVVAAIVRRDGLVQLGTVVRDALRPRGQLIAENALLRRQLLVLHRQVARPRLTPTDRWWMVVTARVTKAWKQALLIVQPATPWRMVSPTRWSTFARPTTAAGI
jgi:hypothetical protein